MRKEFMALIAPFKEKLENILKIGSSTRINGSDGSLQEIQIKTLRNIEDALKVGQFGFNSKQPIGSRNIVAKIGNEKIVIANEHIASIIDVSSGDSVVYNANGDYVKIESNKITIKAINVTIDSVLTELKGNLKVTGSIEGASIKDTTLNVTVGSHFHTQPNDGGGNVEAPTAPPTTGT